MKKRIGLIAVAMVVMAVVIAGCGSEQFADDGGAQAPGEPGDAGEARVDGDTFGFSNEDVGELEGPAAGALAPVVGWSAVTGNVTGEALLLFAIVFLWTPPHFWALALFRSGDYGKAGIPMLPVVAGKAATKRQILLYTLLLLPVALAPSLIGMSGLLYGIGAGLLDQDRRPPCRYRGQLHPRRRIAAVEPRPPRLFRLRLAREPGWGGGAGAAQ